MSDPHPARSSGEKEDKFDADMALTTGELGKLIPELVEALGGELVGGLVPLTAPVAPTAPGAGAEATTSNVTEDDSAPF